MKLIKRALRKTELGLLEPNPGGFDDVLNDRAWEALDVFRRGTPGLKRKVPVNQGDLDELEPYFDRYGKWRWNLFVPVEPKTAAEITFERLLAAMKEMDTHSSGYLLGGGHGIPMEKIDITGRTDCSSSCSWVLWKADLFDEPQAWVSGQLESWGSPGVGKAFTLYANSEHVWIRLHKTRWWRFDTSPHVDGHPSENPRRGPRLRFYPRFTSSFVPRHWPGM